MTFGKHLFRSLALGALAVGLFAGPTAAQNGSNWHVLSNGLDVIYLGLGAGGTTAQPGVDGIGFWLDGADMQSSRLTSFGDFGYHAIKFRTSQCVLGAPSPTLGMKFPGIVFLELDGTNQNRPDVFVKPEIDGTTGIPGITTGGFVPYGAPAGTSASFVAFGLIGAGQLPSTTPIFVPNGGLVPSSNGGTLAIVGLATGVNVPISSTGFCWVLQFTWTPTALLAFDDVDGWWTWMVNSPDNNQYWGMSDDELGAIQSRTIASDGGGTALIPFLAGTNYEWHSMSGAPSTNLALAPTGYEGTGTYYAITTGPVGGVFGAGGNPNGGFDLGYRDGFVVNGASIIGGGASLNPNTGLGNQDPAGSPILGLVPTIGFTTWNNKSYTGAGSGGSRLAWLDLDFNGLVGFDVQTGATPEALVWFGTVRAPLKLNDIAFPMPFLADDLFPLYVHATPAGTAWPDPSGFAAGTFGVPPTVGNSLNAVLGTGTPTWALGVGGGVSTFFYGTSGLTASGGLTWNPDVNEAGGTRQVIFMD